MSDYENIKRWWSEEESMAQSAIAKFTESIAQCDAWILEFSECSPETAKYYREAKGADEKRLEYFKLQLESVRQRLATL